MVIETKRAITSEEAREVTNILYNARQLIKKPERKLSDVFGFCRKGTIFCFVAILFFGFFLITGDRDVYTLTGIIITIICVIFLFVFSSGIQKTYQSLMVQETEHVIVTFDEKSIDYEVVGNRRLQTAWENVAFVRRFSKMIFFMPKDVTGILVSVSVEYLDQVKDFIRENQIDVRMINMD